MPKQWPLNLATWSIRATKGPSSHFIARKFTKSHTQLQTSVSTPKNTQNSQTIHTRLTELTKLIMPWHSPYKIYNTISSRTMPINYVIDRHMPFVWQNFCFNERHVIKFFLTIFSVKGFYSAELIADSRLANFSLSYPIKKCTIEGTICIALIRIWKRQYII